MKITNEPPSQSVYVTLEKGDRLVCRRPLQGDVTPVSDFDGAYIYGAKGFSPDLPVFSVKVPGDFLLPFAQEVMRAALEYAAERMAKTS